MALLRRSRDLAGRTRSTSDTRYPCRIHIRSAVRVDTREPPANRRPSDCRRCGNDRSRHPQYGGDCCRAGLAVVATVKTAAISCCTRQHKEGDYLDGTPPLPLNSSASSSASRSCSPVCSPPTPGCLPGQDNPTERKEKDSEG